MPPVQDLCSQGAERIELDIMCRFGSPHLKPTAIATAAQLNAPHHHDPLVGLEVVNDKKQFKTKRAQVYPPELCSQWAAAWISGRS